MSVPGYEAPLHRALTEPILIGGAARAWTILNGTLAAVIGIALQVWIGGLVVWIGGQALGAWLTRIDPDFVEVFRRHVKHRPFLDV